LWQDPREQFRKWQKELGDIFSLKLGPHAAVVIGSYQLLKDAYVSNANLFSHRPEMYLIDRVAKRRGLLSIFPYILQ
jgi:cytochrome P450 family 2 subfamily U polypeptide 1